MGGGPLPGLAAAAAQHRHSCCHCRCWGLRASSIPILLPASNPCPPPHTSIQVPEVFSEDLFAVLGPGRPDHRWLIVGPARSGSTFHQDPNATCAWNAVVRGSKKWVMYPPHATPPGVRPSADGADVASPVSLTEWFLSFYDHRAAGGRAPAECVVRTGEVLFVPRQWWHLAINLEVGSRAECAECVGSHAV